MALEGWICPRCGKVNSPFTSQCTCTKNNKSDFEVTCSHKYEYNTSTTADGSVHMICS